MNFKKTHADLLEILDGHIVQSSSTAREQPRTGVFTDPWNGGQV